MDLLFRTIAIIIEVVILAALAYAVLNGVRLAALDLGIKSRYNKVIIMALFAAGAILVVFFTAHLTTFYPTI